MKRAFIISAVLLIVSVMCIARGNSKLDSLIILLKNTDNELVKANIYLEISDFYWSDDPTGCKENAVKALEIGKRYGSHKLLFNAYKNLGAASAFGGNYREALNNDLLSLQEAVRLRSDSLICNISINIGNDYTSLGRYDSANIYFDLGIKLACRLGLKHELCDHYLNKGNNQYYNSKLSESEAYYEKGLRLALGLKDEDKIVMFYNNIASVRLYRGISDSIVIRYISEAIKINEKNKNYLQLADSYTTLASAYSVQGNQKKTLLYLKKSYETFRSVHNEVKAIPALCSLADLYREMNMLDSAARYADIAIKYGESSGYVHGLASAYSVKGYILSGESDYKNAGRFLKKAFDEFIELDAAEGILFSGNQLAVNLAKQGKLYESIEVSLKVFNLARKLSNYQALKNISLNLANVYSQVRDYKQAFNYQQIAALASDTINNSRNKELLDEMEAKYETEKKENEIIQLKASSAVKEHQRKTERNYWIIGSVFIVLFVISLMIIWQQKRKFKYELDSNELKNRLNRLQTQPHFIKNTLDYIDYHFIRNNDIENTSLYIKDLRELIVLMLENSQNEFIPLQKELEVLDRYMRLINLKTENNVRYEIEISPEIDIERILIPPTLIQPLVENAFIHAFKGVEKPQIIISILFDNGLLICQVTDNGRGRSTKASYSLDFKNMKTGFGHSLINERLELINKKLKTNGRMIIEDLKDKDFNPIGTRAKLYIPIEFAF